MALHEFEAIALTNLQSSQNATGEGFFSKLRNAFTGPSRSGYGAVGDGASPDREALLFDSNSNN
jgi:hypothetical protein